MQFVVKVQVTNCRNSYSSSVLGEGGGRRTQGIQDHEETIAAIHHINKRTCMVMYGRPQAINISVHQLLLHAHTTTQSHTPPFIHWQTVSGNSHDTHGITNAWLTLGSLDQPVKEYYVTGTLCTKGVCTVWPWELHVHAHPIGGRAETLCGTKG